MKKPLAMIRLGTVLMCVAWQGAAIAVDDGVLNKLFYMYKDSAPTAPGVAPGTPLNKSNVEAAKDALPPSIYDFVKKGELEIRVEKAFDFTPNKGYIEATRKNDGVGFDAKGNLTNFAAGKPFPTAPQQGDAQAGLKLMWNYNYGRVWGDLGCLNPWFWEYRNMSTGAIERTLEYDRICFKRYFARTQDDPKPQVVPNPSNLYRGIYLRVANPQDVRDTQLLIHKYIDDTKPMDAWLYLGFQRRVRRFPVSQLTDAFLGADIMIEDFEGYEGPISAMTYKYLGTKPMLTTFWDRANVTKGKQHSVKQDDGTTWDYTDFGGQGGCMNVTHQLRTTHIVESIPKDPSHPISKRIHYIDAQTGEIPTTEIYDRKGQLWKVFTIGWVHPDPKRGGHPKNAGTGPDAGGGNGADIGDTFSVIDVQARHCTLGYFRGITAPDVAPESWFSLQEMRGTK